MLNKHTHSKLPLGIIVTIAAALLLLAASMEVAAAPSVTITQKITIERIVPIKKAATSVVKISAPKTAPKPSKKQPAKNTITIPRMGVDTELLEGSSESTLHRGLWHLPGTSDPKKGGNMVIAGHRYKWLPPSKKTFWNMDKLKNGDEITVVWEGTKYTYRVSKISTVTPDKVEILKNTSTHKLTLFTCTPKFSSKYRLVVEATLATGDVVNKAGSHDL